MLHGFRPGCLRITGPQGPPDNNLHQKSAPETNSKDISRNIWWVLSRRYVFCNMAPARGCRDAPFFSAIWSHPVPGGAGRCPAAGGESSSKERIRSLQTAAVKKLFVATRGFRDAKFFPLCGGTRCPATLGGARRPVATAVVFWGVRCLRHRGECTFMNDTRKETHYHACVKSETL